MGSSLTMNEPSALLVTPTARFVPTFLTRMSAPDITAPETSVTVPLMAPMVCCAREGRTQKKRPVRNTTSNRDDLNMTTTPFFPDLFAFMCGGYITHFE